VGSHMLPVLLDRMYINKNGMWYRIAYVIYDCHSLTGIVIS
jgi:hypothetical protein